MLLGHGILKLQNDMDVITCTDRCVKCNVIKCNVN